MDPGLSSRGNRWFRCGPNVISEHQLYAKLFPHLIYKSGFDVPLLLDKETTLTDTESSVQITDG